MRAQKYSKYKFLLVLLLCGVASVIALSIGVTNVQAAETGDNQVTVYYSLYTQRDIEASQNTATTEKIWYEEVVSKNSVLDEKTLDSVVASNNMIFNAESSQFLSEKDKEKINNQKITWYVSNSNKTKSLSQLKEQKFDFTTPLTGDVYIEGVIDADTTASDTKWVAWVLLGGIIAIIIVAIIMAVIRNHTTRLTLDNKKLMTQESIEKLEEIKEIERRKSKYSPINDDTE